MQRVKQRTKAAKTASKQQRARGSAGEAAVDQDAFARYPVAVPTSQTNDASERQQRPLTPGEERVRAWLRKNYGVLSRVAREMVSPDHPNGLSVQFVQRIAYNREARSKGWKVEKRLKALGCPLMQKIPQ